MGVLSGLWDSIKDLFTGGRATTWDPAGAPSGSRLYVGNLSYKVKEEEIRALFAKYGRIKSLHLIRDRLTRRLKGYAFLEMSPEDAQKSLALNGVDFLGRKLVVSIAKSKQQKTFRRATAQKFRRRRSGPRAYGQKDSTPMERLE